MNRVKIKILEDSHLVIKVLYSKHINVYKIEHFKNDTFYTIDYDDLDRIPFEFTFDRIFGIKGLISYIKYNKHFYISMLLSIIIIYIASNVIIDVKVVHNDKHIREIIESKLSENGIHPLTFKKSYDELQMIKTEIKDEYMMDIEWIEIIDDGMRYTVKVVERVITKEDIKDEYCDVISTKDAIITSSNVKKGNLLVSTNDYVKKGTTLISGDIIFKDEVKSKVCAEGDIYATVWYTVNIAIPKKYIQKKYTHNTHKNIAFTTNDKINSIFKVHYDNYDSDLKELLKIGSFKLYIQTDREYIPEEYIYNLQEATTKALEMSKKKLKDNLDKTSTILSEKVLQTNEYDSIIELEIFYSVKERIGKTVVRNEGGIIDEIAE